MSKPGLVLPRRRFLQAMLTAPLLLQAGRAFAEGGDEQQGPPPQGPMAAVAERYAALKSYSDKGTVTTDYQWPDTPLTTEHHRFETAFRAPRNFYFRFDGDPETSGDVFVIWCDGGDFQSWWKSTGVHDVYDGGRGAMAFLTGGSPTKESANLVAPHFFPQAVLYGPTSRLIGLQEAGEEEIGGKACRKLLASGRQTGVTTSESRPTKLWIDRESGLVRQLVTEAEAGSAAGLVDRTAFTLVPVADPEIGDERFTFTPPT